MPLPNVAVGAPHAKAHNDERKRINVLEQGAKFIPRRSMVGPAHSEVPVFTTGIPLDAAFNETYVIGANTLPALWPVDTWGDMSIVNNLWCAKTSVAGLGTVQTHRVMTDGLEICFFNYSGFEMNLFIDGQPYANNPILPAATTGYAPFGMSKLVFPSQRPRLLEFVTANGLVGIYTKKPYRIWKPAKDPNPKVAVFGDSFVYPLTMSDTVAGAHTPDPWIRGMYQQMAPMLGITSLTTDGIGGTGYIAPSGSNKPYTHVDRLAWLNRLQPDVIVAHGGGANDLYTGNTVANTITAAINHFKNLREQHPAAKLVFVEGFAPPLFTPATFNPNYKLIREGVQAGLLAEGVDAYFLDIATTRPPFSGTGYVTAPVANDNTSIYIGSDQVHYTVKGAKFLASIVAPKLARVMADQGDLLGQLVL